MRQPLSDDDDGGGDNTGFRYTSGMTAQNNNCSVDTSGSSYTRYTRYTDTRRNTSRTDSSHHTGTQDNPTLCRLLQSRR